MFQASSQAMTVSQYSPGQIVIGAGTWEVDILHDYAFQGCAVAPRSTAYLIHSSIKSSRLQENQDLGMPLMQYEIFTDTPLRR